MNPDFSYLIRTNIPQGYRCYGRYRSLLSKKLVLVSALFIFIITDAGLFSQTYSRIASVRLEDTVYRNFDTINLQKLVIYRSDSNGIANNKGQYFYVNYRDYEFIMDTMAFLVMDTGHTFVCEKSIELSVMYMTKKYKIRKHGFLLFRRRCLVILRNNSCSYIVSYKILLHQKKRNRKIEKVEFYCN